MEEFNINSQNSYVNEDINVVFTPNSSVTKYECFLYKDNQVIKQELINENKPYEFILKDTGIYKIQVKTYDLNNKETVLNTGLYKIDKEAPTIKINASSVDMQVGDVLKPLDGIEVTDNVDGNLINNITTNIDELNLNTPGSKTLIYTVSDQAGNKAYQQMNINVMESNNSALVFIQISIIFILAIIAILILFYRRSVCLEKRIAKYSVEPLKDTSIALFDRYWDFYYFIIKKIEKIVGKSEVITKHSHKFDKYVGILNKNYTKGLDFICSKILVAIIFVLIAIFSKTIQYEILNLYEACFPLLVGYLMPNIIYVIRYKIHRNKVENDLLQAIIVMNNAFKSGRSISQAILLVTTELDGAIAEEFRKMHLELSFGLSVDVVFKRFAERINLEEVNYLTSSLSVLNKTGGNIIKVFSAIEKSLFDKKRLKLELASLTGSSKLIFYCLICVPILFVIFISIINPNYFKVFYTTSIGIVILTSIIIIYIVYIIIIRKIMKVRM